MQGETRHVALLRALGLAFQVGQDEAEFLAGENFRRVDGGGTLRNYSGSEGDGQFQTHRIGSVWDVLTSPSR